MLAVGPVVGVIRGQVAALNARSVPPQNRILRSVAGLQRFPWHASRFRF
jgi:hypothetical protein